MSVDPEGTPDPGNSPDPAVADAQFDWESDDNPYKKRFRDTQAAYTPAQQAAAELQRIKEDEAYFKDWLSQEKGLEYDEDDDDPIEETAAPAAKPDPRLEELMEFKQQTEAERATKQFEDDLTKAAGDRTVPKHARNWILEQAVKGGSYEALQAAVKEVLEHEDSLVEQAAQKRKQRPRAPHVPTGGTATDGRKSTADMTDSELLQYQMDRFNAEAA